jgi:photosystem II stability/assembly factor-like uncharacterized protein
MKVTPFHIFLLACLPALSQAAAQNALDSADLSGLELRNIGPAVMSGRFVDIDVVESDTYIIYAASATGGLFKTTDNGVTWKPVFEREATHSIGDVVVHQKQPDIVWVGTGERANRQSSSWGDGVYKSTDAGETWANMGLEDSLHIGRIVLHPDNPDIVYVAAMGHLWGPNEERGLYKSDDGGKTWRRILYVDEVTGVVDVAMDPSDPNILYAATYQRMRKAFGFHGGGPGSGLHKSTDGGESWKELRNGLPEGDYGRIGISIYRKDPRIVYVCVEQGIRYTASTSYEERLAGIYRSEDKGESWTHMSDWNPRPMYASQIIVDPTDDQRIYMMNAYSFSDDGGKTFTAPRQSVHGDDRFIWVNPKDARHVIKASDGAIAISYDRGLKWLFVASLPVSQYYRVGVDMRTPYWVHGGLQDNGCWAGPSATYRSEGIVNEDWVRTCGGDGFINLIDPENDDIVYTESQYLGLLQVDMRTNEKRAIRPHNDTGYISYSRRNWDVWGKGKSYPLLGEALSPANWDGPVIISPHDNTTLYAGTNQIWKTTDRGGSWTSLGDLTTGIDRSELSIMGQMPTEETPSLDDGIPFYPTLTAIVESPLREGLLYVGTDDGNLQVSRDGGENWTNLAGRFPGVPETTWVAGIEASRFDEATVYAVFDGHRSDDYENYLYKSTDYGETWTSIAGDLPARRVLRAVHEDMRKPNVIYVAAELGFYYSMDGGRHWVELKNNMPTLAINDFVIHPRDNDLVLGSHGRGVWILDNINALQELTPEIAASPSHLFTMEPAEMIRYAGLLANPGDMIFFGENPPAGAIIDYWLAEKDAEDIKLTVLDSTGKSIRELEPSEARGVNRVIWDLRYPRLPDPAGAEPDRRGNPARGPLGGFVMPGTYTIRLQVGDQRHEQTVEVLEDPRMEVEEAARQTWTDTLLELAKMYTSANELVRSVVAVEDRLEQIESSPEAAAVEAMELRRLTFELRRRIGGLHRSISGWTGVPTAGQKAQKAYLTDAMSRIRPRVQALSEAEGPR